MVLPDWVDGLLPSDWLMFAFLVVQLLFIIDYGVFTPWWRGPIGWIVLEYGVGVLLLMGLIIYGVVAGQRVDEWARVLVMTMLLFGAVGKEYILKVSRHEGRIERRERRRLAHEMAAGVSSERPVITERTSTMSTPSNEAVKNATEIWYKAQRVLRTLVQVVIPAFLGFAVVLPLIIEALGLPVDSELRLWLVGVALGVTGVATAISRIMAIPQVNAWLTKIGLGSVPKSAIGVTASTGTAFVKTDVKAVSRG